MVSRFSNRVGMLAIVALGTGSPAGFAQPAQRGPNVPPEIAVNPKLRRDVRKGAIELPTKIIIAGRNPKANPVKPAKAPPPKPAVVDRRKSDIETPVKNVVARGNAGKAVNPKVEPGKVKWHDDFAKACAAARRSGKPVLLFQLLGKLDQRFT